MAYRLELPAWIKFLSVFHVCLIDSAASDSYPGQVKLFLSLIVVDRKEEFEVEEILNSHIQ